MNPSLEYFNGNELASSVWNSKYALKIANQQIEQTPDEMHRRMAKEFARIEDKYGGNKKLSEDEIYNLFKGFGKIIPQGSVMAILGNDRQIGSLSNCVVVPEIFDSYGGICFTDQQLAQLMKRRCGVGADISTLRHAGSFVSNAAQSSTGAVSFMPRFSNTTREVAQDGRRGALMISMDIRHPDSDQFALIKQDLSKITGANISLKLTDLFMKNVQEGKGFLHKFPVESNNVIKTSDAKTLWNTIVKCAHNTAEPGLIFWDKQHRYSPSSIYPFFRNISTNPCSEIAMGNDSCRLISLNMFSCVKNPFTKQAKFDFTLWYDICYKGQRLMDDLIDLELEKIDKIIEKIKQDDEPDYIKEVELRTWLDLRESGERGRRTGLGFTALGDTLAALGFKYDSDESKKVIEEICLMKLKAELRSTIDMADERGCFPDFDANLEARNALEEDSFLHMIRWQFQGEWEHMQKVGRRNISWSTVAPNGSLSLLAELLEATFFGSTSGVEPLFSVYHIRRKKINPNDKESRVDFADDLGDKWQEYPVFHEGFKMWYSINFPDGQPLDQYTKKDIDELIKLSPYNDSTADKIDWRQRIDIQAIIQKYTTHSISSTINLPENVTVEEVGEIYMESWKKGLKGVTVYREGSRTGVLIKESKKKEEFEYHDAPKRPKEIPAALHLVTIKGIKYEVIIGFMNNRPYELFACEAPEEVIKDGETKGKIVKIKKGYYDYYDNNDNKQRGIQVAAARPDEQMLTRLISGMLRHGTNPEFIIEQIDKCPLEIVSFGKAISRVLRKYSKSKKEDNVCPECKEKTLVHEEGCTHCVSCGYSACK